MVAGSLDSMTLRVERVDDTGDVVGSVQAKFHSETQSTLVVDGDEVEVTGTRDPNGILVIHHLANISAGARSRSLSPAPARVILGLFLLPFLGGAIGFVIGAPLGLAHVGGMVIGFIAGVAVAIVLQIVISMIHEVGKK